MCTHGLGNAENTEGKCDEQSNKARLTKALGSQGSEKWPMISAGSNGGGTAYTVDSTEQISTEMAAFTPEEKEKTARLFARTVEV